MGHYRAMEPHPRRGIKGNEEEPGILGKGERERERGGQGRRRDGERRERREARERERMRGCYGSCGPLFRSAKVRSSWRVESAALSTHLRSYIPGSDPQSGLCLDAGAPLAGRGLGEMLC